MASMDKIKNINNQLLCIFFNKNSRLKRIGKIIASQKQHIQTLEQLTEIKGVGAKSIDYARQFFQDEEFLSLDIVLACLIQLGADKYHDLSIIIKGLRIIDTQYTELVEIISEGIKNNKISMNPENDNQFKLQQCKTVYKKWIIIKKLGYGKDGEVFLVRESNNEEEYVLKQFKPNKSIGKIRSEVFIQDMLYENTCVSPKIIDVNLEKKYFVMQKFKQLWLEYIYEHGLTFEHQKQLIRCFELINENGVIQNDPNIYNFMIDYDNRLKIIDYGMCSITEELQKSIKIKCKTISQEKYEKESPHWDKLGLFSILYGTQNLQTMYNRFLIKNYKLDKKKVKSLLNLDTSFLQKAYKDYKKQIQYKDPIDFQNERTEEAIAKLKKRSLTSKMRDLSI